MSALAEQFDPLFVAQEWIADGGNVALATVIETWGSAPQPAGSNLVVDGAGNFVGSVSGGCVEGSVIAEAMEVIEAGKPRVLDFGVSDETAWRVGLTCGGRIRVYVERLGCELERLNAARMARTALVKLTDLESGSTSIILEGDAFEHAVSDEVAIAFRSGISKVIAVGARTLFLNVHLPPRRIVIIGAVHISQVLARMAGLAGFDVRIVDPRSAFATPERFDGIDLAAEWPEDAFAQRQLDPYTALVAVTHDPKIDDLPVIEALKAKCFYVGALGSRKTHASRVERLRAAGIGDAELSHIHAPIGLAIGAASPGEIAVSILAEIIQSMRMVQFSPKRLDLV